MWGNMPEMTLTEAAAWAGKSRTTIFKAIRRGRISATKNRDGEWLIDPSELARVYEPAEAVNAVNVAPSVESVYQDIGGELAMLRQVSDHWRSHAEAQTRLPDSQRRSWWQRLKTA
jgi:Helix-turn-helix domain